MDNNNNIKDNSFFYEEKRDTKMSLTQKDLKNLKKFIEKNHKKSNFNDCDKYYRE